MKTKCFFLRFSTVKLRGDCVGTTCSRGRELKTKSCKRVNFTKTGLQLKKRSVNYLGTPYSPTL